MSLYDSLKDVTEFEDKYHVKRRRLDKWQAHVALVAWMASMLLVNVVSLLLTVVYAIPDIYQPAFDACVVGPEVKGLVQLCCLASFGFGGVLCVQAMALVLPLWAIKNSCEYWYLYYSD